MIEFLRDLFARPGAPRTVILLDPDTTSTLRQYDVRPGLALYAAVIAVVAVAAVLVALAVLTPLRGRIWGGGGADLRGVAQANAARAAALEDSLAVQDEQMAQLRAIITGDADVVADDLSEGDLGLPAPPAVPADVAPPPATPPSGASVPPLRTLGPAPSGAAPRPAAYLAGLRLPALPPVDGVLSRGFDVARGHFGTDYAATVGTPVRAIAGGYVVQADWTHDGGHTIAVQHPGGYLSVYKHNGRLLKRVGERVRARETVALSGDTGEITTGPHLHVEIWRDGFAQDPAALFLAP